MSNEFKENLSVTDGDSPELIEKAKKAILDSFFTENDYYKTISNDPKIKDHYHYIVSAIILEYKKYFPTSKIELVYRFKAENSRENKVIKYLSKEDTSSLEFDESTGNYVSSVKEVKDIFAMKIISNRIHRDFSLCDVDETDTEKYELFKKLLEDVNENLAYLEEMKAFKYQLIYKGHPTQKKYKYECTQKEYYTKCKELLERIKTLIHPSSVELLAYYNNKQNMINNILESIVTTESLISSLDSTGPLVDKDILEDKEINFFRLLNDFTSRIYDRLDLALLTDNIQFLFEDSKILQDLGVTFNHILEEKRTPSGFVANFLRLSFTVPTQNGATIQIPFECQLQSENEYKEANYGHSSHGNMPGKRIPYYKLPNLSDEKGIRTFREFIRYVSPEVYMARLDNTEKDRVFIHGLDDYQNYKHLLAENSDYSKFLPYIEFMYNNKEKLFQNQDRSMTIFNYDLKKYLDMFKQGKILMPNCSRTKNNSNNNNNTEPEL